MHTYKLWSIPSHKTMAQKIEKLVHGYIRECVKEKQVDKKIKDLRLLFYELTEYFKDKEDSIKSAERDKGEAVYIRMNTDDYQQATNSAFGKVIIDPTIKDVEYKWSIKINERPFSDSICIGLSEIDSVEKYVNNKFSKSKEFKNYSYCSDGSTFLNGENILGPNREFDVYGVYREGDVVTMILLNGTLKYSVNDKEEKELFKKIDVNKKYKMAVSLYGDDDQQSCLELLNYSTNK